MTALPAGFMEEMTTELDACTEEELRLERLPEFDPDKHGLIAELPVWLKKYYAAIIRIILALRQKKISGEHRTKTELLLGVMQDIFLIEVQRLYPGDIAAGAISVCKGGLLVNAKGKNVTLTA